MSRVIETARPEVWPGEINDLDGVLEANGAPWVTRRRRSRLAIAQPSNARAAAIAQRVGIEWAMQRGRHHGHQPRHGDLDHEA